MAETEGKELNWDDEITADAQEFVLLPEGDYNVTIEKVDRGRSKGEGKLPPCNMAIVYFTVHGEHGEEVSLRENYILHTVMEWKLSELFRGAGLKKEGEALRMNWSALPGKVARAHITQVPGLKDPSKMFNRIEKLYPKDAAKPAFTPGKF